MHPEFLLLQFKGFYFRKLEMKGTKNEQIKQDLRLKKQEWQERPTMSLKKLIPNKIKNEI